MYGNDDFHNGMLETLHSAREIDGMVTNFTNKVKTYAVPCICIRFRTGYVTDYVCIENRRLIC